MHSGENEPGRVSVREIKDHVLSVTFVTATVQVAYPLKKFDRGVHVYAPFCKPLNEITRKKG